MIPKSVERFSGRKTRSVCAEMKSKPGRMIPKSVERFSDEIMRKPKRA
jgi:hypothetical protein